MDLLEKYNNRIEYSIRSFMNEVPTLTQRQKEIINNKSRYRCFIGYRREGMTTGLVFDLIYNALNKSSQKICLMSYTVMSSRLIFQSIKEKVKSHLIERSNTNEIVFINGSTIRIYTAREQALRGGIFDHVYIDDAISIKDSDILNTLCLCAYDAGRITVCATVENRFPFTSLNGTFLNAAMVDPYFDLNIFQNEEEQHRFDSLMAAGVI